MLIRVLLAMPDRTEAVGRVARPPRSPASFERAYFTHLLERTGGRVGQAARDAGIGQCSLYGKLRRRGLRKEAFPR